MNPARANDLEALRRWMSAHGAPPPPIAKEAIATGTSLDRLLPEGGFPRGAVSVLAGPSGVGRMTIAARFAALEQVIESAAFRVVIAAGIDEAITPARARRIVTASEGARTSTLLVLCENTRMPGAQLRLKLARRSGAGIQIEIERSRGGPPGGKVMIQG